MLARIPLRKQASAEEVAATVYLTNSAAAAMTGQVLALDGGLTVE